VVVFGLGKNLLFKSILGRCVHYKINQTAHIQHTTSLVRNLLNSSKIFAI
jgi:hypothetical protein